MLTHKFKYDGTPKQFHELLRKRGAAELVDSIGRPLKSASATDEWDYEIDSIPDPQYAGDVLYRLDYSIIIRPANRGYWEMTEHNILERSEIACTVILKLRIDGATDVESTCLHPYFEPEFRSIFGIEEQKADDTSAALQQQIEKLKGDTAKDRSERSNRGPSEHDRFRTTLAMWAIKTGMCRSKAHAATSLGIDNDTITNHVNRGWLYSDEDVTREGGYESLWNLYTTNLRKI